MSLSGDFVHDCTDVQSGTLDLYKNKLFLCGARRRGDCGLGRGEVSIQMEALRQLNCMGAGSRAREKLL